MDRIGALIGQMTEKHTSLNENRVSLNKSISLMQDYTTENQIHQKVATTILESPEAKESSLERRLESLEAKLSSLERRLEAKMSSLERRLKLLESKISGLDTTMNKLLVELTAVRGIFEINKAELERMVSDTNFKAALSISKEFRNYFFRTVVIVCFPVPYS